MPGDRPRALLAWSLHLCRVDTMVMPVLWTREMSIGEIHEFSQVPSGWKEEGWGSSPASCLAHP